MRTFKTNFTYRGVIYRKNRTLDISGHVLRAAVEAGVLVDEDKVNKPTEEHINHKHTQEPKSFVVKPKGYVNHKQNQEPKTETTPPPGFVNHKQNQTPKIFPAKPKSRRKTKKNSAKKDD